MEDNMRETALSFFRGLAGSYDTTLDYATLFQDRYWKQWVFRRLGTGEGDLVLDVGCGTLLLEERLSNWGCRFVGVDLTKDMIKFGLFKQLGNVVLVVNGDAEALPFPGKAFDAVVSFYVPKYVSVQRLASELGRVTKPGGTVVLYDFAKPRGFWAPFIELYLQGGFRVLGFLLRAARKEESFVFEKLPGIVNATRWDSEIEKSMLECGFETLATQRLTGGVVYLYWGRRLRSP